MKLRRSSTGRGGLPLGAVVALAAVLVCCPAVGQDVVFKLKPNRLPAAIESDPLGLSLDPMDPVVYDLLMRGMLAIRWGETVLPVSYKKPIGWRDIEIQSPIPGELRRPGLYDVVLWNLETNQALPYRDWVSVYIPSKCEMIEVNVESDVVAAANPVYETNRIEIYRLSTGALLSTIPLPDPQKVVAFTPDAEYAWIALDESKRKLVRLRLSDQSIDQQVETEGIWSVGSYFEAAVSRRDPRILVLAFEASTGWTYRMFADGHPLPVIPDTYPMKRVFDGEGRIGLHSSQVPLRLCDVDAAAGMVNCRQLNLPDNFYTRNALWNSLYGVWDHYALIYGEIVDTDSGTTRCLTSVYSGFVHYLPQNGKVLFSRSVHDSASLGLLTLLPTQDEPIRVWAPNWVLSRCNEGILVVRPPQLLPSPTLRADDIVNAASGLPGSLASGEIINLSGKNLGPSSGAGPVAFDRLRISGEVERTRVLFDGVPGAILWASDSRIQVVVPDSVTYWGSVAVQVIHAGLPSSRISLPVADYNPGVFFSWLGDKPYAVAAADGGSVRGPTSPLERGSAARIFATGIGLAAGDQPDWIAGRTAELREMPRVSFGGKQAKVLSAGNCPGFTAGLSRIDVEVPADAPTGDAVELVLSIGSRTGNKTWVAIR